MQRSESSSGSHLGAGVLRPKAVAATDQEAGAEVDEGARPTVQGQDILLNCSGPRQRLEAWSWGVREGDSMHGKQTRPTFARNALVI